jgi:DNA replication and repair protein RecF
VLVTGPNGAGKTNLLESLHVGTQGFSPRTRADAQLVRFGRDAARIALRGERATLNGARLRAAEQLRSEVATLVFTPDRLVVVKGGPAARRAYFDRVLGRLSPSRAGLSAEYGAAVGQRNAALRRVSQGLSSRGALAPWNEQVSRLGAQLVEGRAETVALLTPRFRERAGELGLPDAELGYDAEAPSAEDL